MQIDETAAPSEKPPPAKRKHGIVRAGNLSPEEAREAKRAAETEGRILVFDLETQRSAEEVGGWGNIPKMGLALAVVYDLQRRSYRTYYETDADKLLLDLVMADRVVGFNIDNFDRMLGIHVCCYCQKPKRRIFRIVR